MSTTQQSLTLTGNPGKSHIIAGPAVIAAIWDLNRDFLACIDKFRGFHESWVTVRIPGKTMHFIFDPETGQKILGPDADSFTKSPNYHVFKAILGKGLVTNDGEIWAKQRGIINPFFSMKQYKNYARAFDHHCNRLRDDLKPLVGSEVDICPYIVKTTFELLGDVLFGMDFRNMSQPVSQQSSTAIDYYMKRVFVKLPDWLPLPGHQKAQKALKAINHMIADLIAKEKKRENRQESMSFIEALITAQKDHPHLKDELIRDEVMTMVLAGHETTSHTLSWGLWLLSENQEWQERGASEASGVESVSDFENLKKMDLIRRMVMEFMRLYPAAYAISRSPKEPTDYCGQAIKPGEVLVLPPWSYHRNENYWERPLQFSPDRFLKENFGIRQKRAYIPFGAGTRRCIGSEFGTLEAVAIMTRLLQNFRFLPARNFRPQTNPAITLRPKEGIRLRIEQR